MASAGVTQGGANTKGGSTFSGLSLNWPGKALRLFVALLALMSASSHATSLEYTLPAAGSHAQIIKITTPGRYAVKAKSATGTAIRVTSALLGPGIWYGQAGTSDGAFSRVFAVGDYRIETSGAEAAVGRAEITLAPFEEQNRGRVTLADVQTIETTLAVGERRSYWIDVAEQGVINLELAGRALDSVQVWREGKWLLDLPATSQVEEARLGHPLRFFRLTAQFARGRYRVSAYGADALEWADGEAGQPLYVRRGIPKLPSTYRLDHRASEFGVDRYLVPARAGHFALELPIAEEASIGVNPFREGTELANGSAFATSARLAKISEKSRLPFATVTLPNRVTPLAEVENQFDLVTVRRKAGEPYTLQIFTPTDQAVIRRVGDYWIESVVAGSARDELGATAMVFVGKVGKRPHSLGRESVVELDKAVAWVRRFNLGTPLHMWLRVLEPGRYTVRGTGVDATLGVRPYARPRKGKWRYVAPDAQQSIALQPGYYHLRIEPKISGIFTLQMRGETAVGAGQTLPSIARFKKLSVFPKYEAVVRTSGPKGGLMIRRLPIDLETAFAVTLDPRVPVIVPIRVASAGQVVLEGPSGNRLQLRRPRSALSSALNVRAGRHRVEIENHSTASVQALLRFVPNGAPVAIPPAATGGVLNVDEQMPVRLGPRASAHFEVQIDAPGFYSVGTSGLLATALTVSAQHVPGLLTAERNGPGRNALATGFLEVGRYAVQVSTLGASAGTAGLVVKQLRHTKTADALTTGANIRSRLESGTGLTAFIQVGQAGKYRIRAMDVGKRHPIALSDADGWPLVRPGHIGDVDLDLAAGRYSLAVMPPVQSGFVVAQIVPVPRVHERVGHGPFPVALDSKVTHRWLQPPAQGAGSNAHGDESQAARDVWTFDLTAPVTVEAMLTNEMAARIIEAESDHLVGELTSAQGWVGMLKAGSYRVEASHLRRANRVDYSLSVRLRELTPGQQRTVSVPSRIPLSVLEGAVVIRSHGDADVRAVLRDASGAQIGRADDDNGDWNFRLEKILPKGRYQLEVLPSGSHGAKTTISLTRGVSVTPPNLTKPESPVLEVLEPGVVRNVSLVKGGSMSLKLAAPPGPGLIEIRGLDVVPKVTADGYGASQTSHRATLAWSDMAPETVTLEGHEDAVTAIASLSRLTAQPELVLEHSRQLLLSDGHATRVKLPRPGARVTIDVPTGVTVLAGSATVSLGAPSRLTFDPASADFWLLNSTSKPTTVGLALTSNGVLGDGVAERPVMMTRFTSSGRWHLQLPVLTVPAEVFVRGAVEHSRVQRLNDLAL
ncbi:MAG: hypothetical protein HOI95_18670, partial [Chromatiales bacterium]|nr:hypothetical protein [Chromatiales bacterium]